MRQVVALRQQTRQRVRGRFARRSYARASAFTLSLASAFLAISLASAFLAIRQSWKPCSSMAFSTVMRKSGVAARATGIDDTRHGPRPMLLGQGLAPPVGGERAQAGACFGLEDVKAHAQSL